MNRLVKGLLLGALLLPLAGLRAEAVNGEAAPAFTLKNTDGKEVSLADYKGKLVVLEWVNEGCPFVKKHYGNSGNLPSLQEKYVKKGVVWLSICSSAEGKQGWWESADEAAAWRKKEGAAMSELLKDPDGSVGHAYGAKTTPHLYVIAKDGTLAYQGAIDSIASTKAKDIPKATNWVAQALDELLAGKPVSVGRTRSYGCSVKYAE